MVRLISCTRNSRGVVSSMLATTYYPLLKVSSLHLIEPLLVGQKVRDLDGQLPKIADRQKDIWSCSEEAFRDLRARPFLRAWDERILRILVVRSCHYLTFTDDVSHCKQEHGLRPLPTAEYPDLTKGITHKCTKRQEVVSYESISCRNEVQQVILGYPWRLRVVWYCLQVLAPPFEGNPNAHHVWYRYGFYVSAILIKVVY